VGSLLTSALISAALVTALPESRPPATIKSLNSQIQIAANAALAYKATTGRLPSTLQELRGRAHPALSTPDFYLDGVMYFREESGQPRLSWRDDSSAAFCSLKAAQAGRCV